LFTSPPTQALEWNDSAVEGAYRFIRRVWNFANQQQFELQTIATADWNSATRETKTARREIHEALAQALRDFEREWGNIKLEDNWRRSQRSSFDAFPEEFSFPEPASD